MGRARVGGNRCRLTVRCVNRAHDTVVPLRDGSGNSSGSGIGITGRRTVVDIFVDEPSSDAAALTYDTGVHVDARLSPPAENEDVLQAAARERAVEDEVQGKRRLLEEFRRRLEDVEARVGVMEAQIQSDKAVEALREAIRVVPAPSCDDANLDSSSERTVVRRGGRCRCRSSRRKLCVSCWTGCVYVVLKRVAGRLNFASTTAITTTATMLFLYSYISSRIG